MYKIFFVLIFIQTTLFSQINRTNYETYNLSINEDSYYTSDENIRIANDEIYRDFWNIDDDDDDDDDDVVVLGKNSYELWADNFDLIIKKTDSTIPYYAVFPFEEPFESKPHINKLTKYLKQKKIINYRGERIYNSNKISDLNDLKTNYPEKGLISQFWKTDNQDIYIGVLRLLETVNDGLSKKTFEHIYDVYIEVFDSEEVDVFEIINGINFVLNKDKNDPKFYYSMSQHDRWYQRGRGDNYFNRNRLKYLNFAIELDSTNAEYFYKRGYAYFGLMNDIKSLENMRKSVKLDPDNSYYRRGLAYTFFNAELSADSIIFHIDKAIELDNKNSYKIDKSIFLNDLGLYSESLDVLSSIDTDTSSLEFKKIMNRYEVLLQEANQGIRNLNSHDANEFYKRSGKFYPFEKLSEKDTLNYPIQIGLSISLNDIFNFKEIREKENVQLSMSIRASSKSPPVYHTIHQDFKRYTKDSIDIADLSKRLMISALNGNFYPKEGYYSRMADRYQYVFENESFEIGNNFKFRDFPFDTQEVTFRFQVTEDSSIYAFSENDIAVKILDIKGLQDGYSIDNISTNLGFTEAIGVADFAPGSKRNIVMPYADITILIKRSGSLLFIKLFLGTFLAVLMSMSTFYINKRNFGSRIDVSVGALFICVGNKYFVESVTPIAQVLTKADIINNISLILIIANVLFVIGQHKPEIKLGKFEDSMYTLKFSLISFLLVLFLTILI
tara:strand:+ start:1846 stop:4023 length:2178 start_codon:yes stop_codon:yes gene_type:complete